MLQRGNVEVSCTWGFMHLATRVAANVSARDHAHFAHARVSVSVSVSKSAARTFGRRPTVLARPVRGIAAILPCMSPGGSDGRVTLADV